MGNGAIIILNVQTNSYITAPTGLCPLSQNSHSLTASLGLEAVVGVAVYGGVPGSPTDAHAQWVIVPNSDNSIRYSSSIPNYLFLLILSLL